MQRRNRSDFARADAPLITAPLFGAVRALNGYALGKKYRYLVREGEPQFYTAALSTREGAHVVFLHEGHDSYVYVPRTGDILRPVLEEGELYFYQGPYANGPMQVRVVRLFENYTALVRIEHSGLPAQEFVTTDAQLQYETRTLKENLTGLSYGCRVVDAANIEGTLYMLDLGALQASYWMPEQRAPRTVRLWTLRPSGTAATPEETSVEADFINFFTKEVVAMIDADPTGVIPRKFATGRLPDSIWLPGELPDSAAWRAWFAEHKEVLGPNLETLTGVRRNSWIVCRTPELPRVTLTDITRVRPLPAETPESPEENIVLRVRFEGKQDATCAVVLHKQVEQTLLLPRHLANAGQAALKQFLSENNFAPDWSQAVETSRVVAREDLLTQQEEIHVRSVVPIQ